MEAHAAAHAKPAVDIIVLLGRLICASIVMHCLAGPLAYIEQSDSFLTCNSAFELECYKYKTLAAASGEKVAEGAKQRKPQGGMHTLPASLQAWLAG